MIVKVNIIFTIVSFTLVACATAKPAYSYQQPIQISQPHVASLPVQAQQFVSQPLDVVAPQSQYLPPSAPAPVQQFVNNPASQYVAPVQQHTAFNQQYLQPLQQTIISKDIYIHSAPEETEEIGNDRSAESGPIRKNYRIIFVKAPVQNIRLNLQSLKRAQAANEEKTVIYVLSKKPDLANIQSQLVNVQTEQKAHKPEVYFIKYKTQEEANRAQQEIQAQYDALGGATHISDEGIAPVSSVIGGASVNVGPVVPGFVASASNSSPSLASSSNFGQSSFQGNQAAASSPVNFAVGASNQKYLPPQKN